MATVRIEKRNGFVEAIPYGETPAVELDLEPGQYVVAFELSPRPLAHPSEETVDWRYSYYLATPLGSNDA